VLGHPEYYSKFGFVPARKWGISAPFEVSDDAFMGIELQADALLNASGVVEYPEEFLEV
jgi:predicted N-acetyltransferase YhbS